MPLKQTTKLSGSFDRRSQILSGALTVFSTKGFAAATNREIAQAAGINSPGLIYHYFAGKEDLLRATIEHFAPPLQLAAHPAEFLAMAPADGLIYFGRTYLGLLNEPQLGKLLRILIAESMRSAPVATIFRTVGPSRIWQLLTAFLEHKMQEGLIRRVDPATAAWCFLGPLGMRMFAEVVLELPDIKDALPIDELLYLNAEIFLSGLKSHTSVPKEAA